MKLSRYYYHLNKYCVIIKYPLEQPVTLVDEQGNIEQSELDPLNAVVKKFTD